MEAYDDEDDLNIVPSCWRIRLDLDENGAMGSFMEIMAGVQDAYNSGEACRLFFSMHSSSRQSMEVVRRVLAPYANLRLILCEVCSGYGPELILDFIEHGGPIVTIADTATFLVSFPGQLIDINYLTSPGTGSVVRAHHEERQRVMSRLRYLGLGEESLGLLDRYHSLEISARTMQRMVESIGDRVRQ